MIFRSNVRILRSKCWRGGFTNPNSGKNLCMDRLYVSNIEDTEVLYESSRDRENVRDDPPSKRPYACKRPYECKQPSARKDQEQI